MYEVSSLSPTSVIYAYQSKYTHSHTHAYIGTCEWLQILFVKLTELWNLLWFVSIKGVYKSFPDVIMFKEVPWYGMIIANSVSDF